MGINRYFEQYLLHMADVALRPAKISRPRTRGDHKETKNKTTVVETKNSKKCSRDQSQDLQHCISSLPLIKLSHASLVLYPNFKCSFHNLLCTHFITLLFCNASPFVIFVWAHTGNSKLCSVTIN